MSTALVRRPTEDAALSSQRASQKPSVARLLDLLIVARATDDRRGQQLFGCLLDRRLGTVPQLS